MFWQHRYPAPPMLEGWFFITAALLALSGGAKIRDPEPTRGALVAAGFPGTRVAVMGLALAEVTAGLAGLMGLRWGAVAMAVLYGGFAGFVGLALWRRLPLQSCGCFGKVDTPPTPLHLIVNAAASAAAMAAALRGGIDLALVLPDQPGGGLPYLFFVGIGTYLLILVLTRLPMLSRKARGLTS